MARKTIHDPRQGPPTLLLRACISLMLLPLTAQALTLLGVQSRKTHAAGVGARDVAIDITQALPDKVTVEPRAKSAAHTLVFQFDEPIAAEGTLTAIDDTLAPLAGASAARSGNTVIVTLPAVNDNARAIVTLSGVNGTGGFTASAALGFKVGDVDGNGAISSVDISRIKARTGQSAASGADATQPRHDLNASGSITAADVAAAKARPAPVQLAAGNASNAAPVVSVDPVGTAAARQAIFVSGTASDDGLPFGALFTTWSTVSGPGVAVFGDRTKLVTPVVFPAAGPYTLRLTANDGQRAATADATVNVVAANPLEVQPPLFQFAPVAVGQSSAATDFLLVNTAATAAANLFYQSNNAAEFSVSFPTCVANGVLAGLSFCTFAVTFSPSSTGNKSATITVSASPGGTTALLVQGTGQ